jgi:hypothetical protein
MYMIRTYLAIVLITMFIENSESQGSFKGYEKLYNTAQYVQGNDKIVQFLYQNIQFPFELLTEPTVTVLIGVVEISPAGKTLRIFSLNDIEPPFINEFRRQMSKLDDSWISNGKDTTYFIIPLEFRNVPEELCQPEYLDKPEFINNPLVCILDMPANGFVNDTVYLKSYEDLLYQHKYNKALANINLLINRQPFNKDLYLKKIQLLTYMDNLKNAKLEEIKTRLIFNNQLEDKSRTTIEEQ